MNPFEITGLLCAGGLVLYGLLYCLIRAAESSTTSHLRRVRATTTACPRTNPGGPVKRLESVLEDTEAERIAGWLQPGLVLLGLRTGSLAPSVEGALRSVAGSIALAHHLDPAIVHDALWRREQAGSTAMGAGFAVPHGRVGGIDRPIVAYVRLEPAIRFGAGDGSPVSSCLVIIVPRDGADDDHLALLALVARLFSDRRFRKQVDRAQDVPSTRVAFASGIARLLGR